MQHLQVHALFWCLLFPFCGMAQTSNAVGDAVADDDECYTVTIPAEWQNGAVWFLETIDLSEPFVIDLKLNFGFNDEFGADGIVFVMQTVGTGLLGEPGGGLGFGGISPSFGVEFDTFQNNDFGDIYQDHLAMVSNGSVVHTAPTNLEGPVPATGSGDNIEDGQDHLFRLVWDPTTDVVEVYFDCELRMTHTIDLVSDIFAGTNEVYWGFTGSTGGFFNAQTVCLDEFTLGLPDDVSLCEGESVQLGVNGPEDGTYSWTPVDGVSDPGIQDPVFTPETTTTYTVEYSDACGEVQTDEVTVSVTELDVTIGPDQEICEGEVAVFTADATDGATFTWGDGSDGDTFETTASGGVEVVAELDGCLAVDDANVAIVDPPAPDSPLPPETELCEGETLTLDATCTGCTYDWGTATTATLEVSTSGTYTVELTSPSGCTASFSADVLFTLPPEPTLPELVEICDGTTATLNPEAGASWAWNTGATTGTLTVSEPGTYTVTVTEGPCTATASTEVVTEPAPQWTGATQFEICNGESVVLFQSNPDITVDFGDGQSSLEVFTAGVFQAELTDLGSGCQSVQGLQVDVLPEPALTLPATATFCEGTVGSLRATVFPENTPVTWSTEDSGILLQLQEPGTYTATAENTCGTSEASTDVDFEACTCQAWVPNAFTPDYDGINDVFAPVLECTPDAYVFRIFDRWGEVLFETEQTGDFWQGNVKGGNHFVPAGVYVWQVVYEHQVTGDAVVVELRGTVAVVR